MRIITGKLKGRKINSLNSKLVRPTSAKMKETIFNVLTHGSSSYLKDNLSDYHSILDVCCGTASISFEALSRGVNQAILIDNNSEVLSNALDNAARFEVAESLKTIRSDVRKLGKSSQPSDLCFIDPPYEKSLISPILQALAKNDWLLDGAIVIIEASKREEFVFPDGFEVFNERMDGKTKLIFAVFYKKN